MSAIEERAQVVSVEAEGPLIAGHSLCVASAAMEERTRRVLDTGISGRPYGGPLKHASRLVQSAEPLQLRGGAHRHEAIVRRRLAGIEEAARRSRHVSKSQERTREAKTRFGQISDG
jgi:hypothetical protein